MKKVLITGASGFIGSFLVEEALQKGYEVYAGIRKTSSKQFLQYKNIHFLELDLTSKDTLISQLTEFKAGHGALDFVIHNAGATQAKKLEDFHTVNCAYTKNLVEALQHTMQIEKFVLISSLAAYGPGNKSMEPIQITDEYKPISEYGRSKLKAGQYLASLKDFPSVIIHPTGVYGPRDKDFFQFIKLINKGFEPYIGRYRQRLSLIYVKDLAKAVVAVLGTPLVHCSYLVADGNSYDKEQIGIEAKQILNKKTFRIKLPLGLMRLFVSVIDGAHKIFLNRLPFINREKLDEISSPNWLCNSTAIWKDTNTQPLYDLQKGIAETIDWYKTNKWL